MSHVSSCESIAARWQKRTTKKDRKRAKKEREREKIKTVSNFVCGIGHGIDENR